MTEFQIRDQSWVRPWMEIVLGGVCDDADELSKYLGVTAAESDRAQGMLQVAVPELIAGNPSKREAAILFLTVARGVAQKALLEAAEVEAVVLAAGVAQGLITKSAGQCLGIQLGKHADSALARIREGGAEGGRKGARTRRLTAIRVEDVVAEARKLGWPKTTAGLNKRLSGKFGCDPAHIGRILRKAISDM